VVEVEVNGGTAGDKGKGIGSLGGRDGSEEGGSSEHRGGHDVDTGKKFQTRTPRKRRRPMDPTMTGILQTIDTIFPISLLFIRKHYPWIQFMGSFPSQVHYMLIYTPKPFPNCFRNTLSGIFHLMKTTIEVFISLLRRSHF
jgi:hypothetical protein